MRLGDFQEKFAYVVQGTRTGWFCKEISKTLWYTPIRLTTVSITRFPWEGSCHFGKSLAVCKSLRQLQMNVLVPQTKFLNLIYYIGQQPRIYQSCEFKIKCSGSLSRFCQKNQVILYFLRKSIEIDGLWVSFEESFKHRLLYSKILKFSIPV